MLYKTTGKVIDFGKDNFQDFIRGEKESINLTSTYLNRPMSLAPHGGSVTANHHQYHKTNSQSQNKTLSQNQERRPNGSHLSQINIPEPSQLIQDGSCKAAGSTWDANHLDSFLKTSKFAQTGAFESSYPRALEQTSYSKSLRTKQPRLAPDKSGSYYMHLSSVNHLVTNPGGTLIQHVSHLKEAINDKMLDVPLKTFNREKLNYTPNVDIESAEQQQQHHQKLQRPIEKRQELIEAKQHQEFYQKWRSDCFEKNRAYRVAKNGFRSGILNLDNPEQENTVLYRQEQELWKRSLLRQMDSKVQREKTLNKFNSANPSLEFDNSKHLQKVGVENKLDHLLNQNVVHFPQRNYELENGWVRKKEVKFQFIEEKKNTNDRLFGSNAAETKTHTINQRALYLRAQELRGKNYDLISLVKNDLPLQG